ncbi:hypothetical protein GCM10023193_02820 [Planotetraspora kaengkrachanensis]|uniref:DUF1570 domain-containing protein n=1 Tax=Planotetraspora kaengkrachanensis TaxID=575193 RepID=A0A8J3LUR7_9ACTN|nr:hypothetical protein Pka01_02770 [Planotetraspora kaengkrachanensis]
MLAAVLVVFAVAGPSSAAAPDTLLPMARAIAREHPGMWTQAAVARGGRTIVLAGSVRQAAEVASVADRAGRTVARVWGPVDAVVLVPGTEAQAAELAAPAHVEGFAAFAGVGRVIVDPSGFGRLSAIGRQVVLTHELTHVATGAALGGDMPAWLVEGFADYVGYLDAPLTVRAVAAELAEEVRAGSPPRELPGRSMFQAGSARLPQAYEEAWLACRYIAERFGEPALVHLYRAALRSGVTAALEETLGMTLPALTEAWRGYVVRQLGPVAASWAGAAARPARMRA